LEGPLCPADLCPPSHLKCRNFVEDSPATSPGYIPDYYYSSSSSSSSSSSFFFFMVSLCSLGWSSTQTQTLSLPGIVVHVCNPSYSGDRDQEDHSLNPAPRQTVHGTLFQKYPSQSRVDEIIQVVEHLPITARQKD
jgi:hypothetical protein